MNVAASLSLVANPEAASIGTATKVAMGDRWEEFAKNVKVMKMTRPLSSI